MAWEHVLSWLHVLTFLDFHLPEDLTPWKSENRGRFCIKFGYLNVVGILLSEPFIYLIVGAALCYI